MFVSIATSSKSMVYSTFMGSCGPYFLSLKDIFISGGPQFTPKRHKLKGYQKCKRKRHQ